MKDEGVTVALVFIMSILLTSSFMYYLVSRSQEDRIQASSYSEVSPVKTAPDFALELFNQVNEERIKFGEAPLGGDINVTYLAQIRSNDMASRGYFAHVSPEGISAFSLLDVYGVPNGWAGENLARNDYHDSQTVGIAIRDLMNSPSHRRNILSSHYTSVGVAATVNSTGMYYYTMIFTGPG